MSSDAPRLRGSFKELMHCLRQMANGKWRDTAFECFRHMGWMLLREVKTLDEEERDRYYATLNSFQNEYRQERTTGKKHWAMATKVIGSKASWVPETLARLVFYFWRTIHPWPAPMALMAKLALKSLSCHRYSRAGWTWVNFAALKIGEMDEDRILPVVSYIMGSETIWASTRSSTLRTTRTCPHIPRRATYNWTSHGW